LVLLANLNVAMDHLTSPRQRMGRLALNRRTIQVVLGCLWLFDGVLKFQPRLWDAGFINAVIAPNAQGQPDPVSWLITHMAHFLGYEQAFWVTVFGLIEIAIGLGLFFKRTVKVALVASFAWAAGIWLFGEGLGGVLTGQVSPLMGAPGAAYLYGLVGLLVWPVDKSEERTSGLASSAIGSGRFGVAGGLGVWSALWFLEAVLWLFPVNRAPSSIENQLASMGPGEPGWYGHFLASAGHAFSGAGVVMAAVFSGLSLLIALGPFLSRRPQIFIAGGLVLGALYWCTGEAFGQLFTLAGTDPNNGPPLFLLGLGLLPTIAAGAETQAFVAPFFERHRIWASLGVCAVALVPPAVAVFPAAAPAASAINASSETSMSMSGASTTASAATGCTPHQSGMRMSGLDLSNTPLMTMGSKNDVMNMDGADASAAAGINRTEANWHYSGPALPSAMANELLADGGNGPDDVHMAASGCASTPTSSQEIGAVAYVQATTRAIASLTTPALAQAAGYQAISSASYPVVYYVNPAVVAANARAKRTLSPQHVDGLIYATTPSGQSVLAAALYLLPSTVSRFPMPYGALVQWHQRTDVCQSLFGGFGGVPPCPTGSAKKPTAYMTMVWQVPVAGGPLAIQPPDIQIVEAAVTQLAAS
jgi:hypothetical protein